jgi:hypothetical protein
MNEISRCCHLLGVKSGATIDEVKKAYRDLVQVWHPDRFSGNERLIEKAQEQLKQINLAYEFLVANAFQDGVLVEPPEEEAPVIAEQIEEAAEPEPELPRSSKAGWMVALAVVAGLCVAVAVIFVIKNRSKPPLSTASNGTTPADATNAQSSTQDGIYAAQLGANPPYSKNILDSMVDLNGERPVMDGDLAILNAPAGDPVQRIQSDHLVTPPFVIRAKVRLGDLNEFRVYCGMGRLIFNGEKNPTEFLVNNFASGLFIRVPRKGLVTSNVWHEIAWEVTETMMTAAVDGEVRDNEEGNYTGIKGYPGIGPGQNLLEVKSFVVEAQRTPTPASVRDQRVYEGNLLSAMAPEDNLIVSNGVDGLSLRASALKDENNRFKTTNQFHAPFTIRTRAKTDSINLRLFCGQWMLTFNHGNRCRELTVKDGQKEIKVKDKGLISPNEWHNFVWKIQGNGMTVEVDNEQRYHKDGDFHNMQVRPGIGTLEGSRVAIDYFIVEKN